MASSVLEVDLFHNDMSDVRKAATIATHLTSFDPGSRAFVQGVFDDTKGLNVQTIEIEFSADADGLRTATDASYIMRSNNVRKILK